ncbi:MAG: LysR family transcriptional regulator [Gammaproteobacteria bacterium]|nr:LysR family transcriptional regulator [Gammaproteobacteria bacterium]
MKLSLDALQVLDAIDRQGSFSAAAKSLHRVPSALSYTMARLESDLGLALFDRSRNRPRLSEAGKELLVQGRVILQQVADTEERMRYLASGWENRLRIAVVDLIPLPWVYPLVQQFYAQGGRTQIQLLEEVYGGCWDALASGRADIVVGAPGEGPQSIGFHQRMLTEVDFVFAVAPGHPLADMPEPLSPEQIRPYRAVSAADSSRFLPPRSSGLLGGQDVLTVPNQQAKLGAQLDGIGVGYLPQHLAAPAIESGELVEKSLLEGKSPVILNLIWRSGSLGGAQDWFLAQFNDMWARDLIRGQSQKRVNVGLDSE